MSNIHTETDAVIRLSSACGTLRQYLYDTQYRAERDAKANEATDGNVSAFEAIVHELREALKAFPEI